MIANDCDNLEALAQKRFQLKNNTQNLKEFQTKYKQIHDLVNTLRPTFSAIQSFKKQGVGSFNLDQTADTLLNVIANIQLEFQNDPSWLTNPQKFKFIKLQQSVTSLDTQAKEQLSQEWEKYRNSRLHTKDELLDILEKIIQFRDTVQNIRKLSREIRIVSYPKDETHFYELDAKLSQIQDEWSSLRSDEFPDDVLNFLKAAANNTAVIMMLTPQVLDWLDEQGIISSFRIRFS